MYSSYETYGDIGPLLMPLMFISLVILVVTIVAMWKLYEKANEAGWKSIIPIYNLYIMYKITWGNGWFFLLLFIPFVAFIIQIITYVKLSKAFGHGGGFACGLIFLNTIFILILGFGSSTYEGVPS